MKDLVFIEGLRKTFPEGNGRLMVLRDVNLSVSPGEFVGIFGPSGSGKTTLLHIILGIERPDSGKVVVDGVDVFSEDEDEVNRLRRRVSMVFQDSYLLGDLSSLENVMLPLLIRGVPKGEAKDKALSVLHSLGLSERVNHMPFQLSGGERQRVALARAMVTDPKLILADEPTGNLDGEREKEVMDLLREMRKRGSFSLIMVTHNIGLLEGFDRVCRLKEGVLEDYPLS